MSKLKPCPFCGGRMRIMTVNIYPDVEKQILGHDSGAQILCPLWRGLTWDGSKEEITMLWNRRADR